MNPIKPVCKVPDLDALWRITPAEFTRIHDQLRKASEPRLNGTTAYHYRHTAASLHHLRSADCNLWQEQTAYEDNHVPEVTLEFYSRRHNEEVEFKDRYDDESIKFCRSCVILELILFLKRPWELEHLFAIFSFGQILGKIRMRVTLRQYRARQLELPDFQKLKTFLIHVIERSKRVKWFREWIIGCLTKDK
jgi:hypothetical protein